MRASLLVLGMFAVVFAGIQPAAAATPKLAPPTMQLAVKGSSQQYVAFDKALRSVLGKSGPVGCSVVVGGKTSGCEVLKAAYTPSSDFKDLTYVFNGKHSSMYQKFGDALNTVQSQFPNEVLTLSFSPVEDVQHDCSGLPQPCVNAPYCLQFGRCSKAAFPCRQC